MDSIPINIFYPENQPLAQRACGLLNDVVHLQSQIESLDNALQQIEGELLKRLRQFVKADKIVTIAEARATVASILPQQAVDQVDQLLSKSSRTEKSTNRVETMMLATIFFDRIQSKITALQAFNMSSSMSLASEAIHGLRLMGNKSTFDEGHQIWVEVADKMSLFTEAWEIGEAMQAFKGAKWLRGISSVVEKLSVVLDVVLIVTAAVEGAQQRAQLRDNIKVLFNKRIMLKTALLEASAPLSWLSLVSALVTIRTVTSSTDASAAAITAVEDATLSEMALQGAKTSFDHVYMGLKEADDSLHAYQDADPTRDQARAATEQSESDATVKKNAVFSGTTGAVMNALQSTMASSSRDAAAESMQTTVITTMGFDLGSIIPLQPWPDNPKRISRCQELSGDLQSMSNGLAEIKNAMAGVGTQLKPRLDACMQAMGLTSFDSLETALSEKCSSQDMEKWRQTKALVDTEDKVQSIVFGVLSIGAAGVGVVGVAMLFVAPPIGAAMLEIAGVLEVAGLVAQELLELVEGADICARCRATMSRLVPARLDARVAYAKMQIMAEWFSTINAVMAGFEKSMTRDVAAALVKNLHLLSDQMAVKYQTYDVGSAFRALQEMDATRQSWVEEG